jgi:hypothetical protein
MRSVLLRVLSLISGAILAVVALECALRLMPVSMGLYRAQNPAEWPLRSYEPNSRYAYSISWSFQNSHRGVTNNYGHIAPFDFQKGSRPVVVVGDSFVESLMNDYADTLQGQLGARLKDQAPVYGLGVSGLSASDYVAIARQAREEFKPRAAIVLLIDGDISESLGHHLGFNSLLPDGEGLKAAYSPLSGESTAKKIRKLIGDISIYRYFQAHLQFSLDKVFVVFQKNANLPSVAPSKADAVYRQKQVVDWVLKELPNALDLPARCIVFLVDSDRYGLYRPELASKPKDAPEAKAYLINQAQRNGFKVSDLEQTFSRLYRQDSLKFDHWPIDRHWNRRGHGVGASEAMKLLAEPSSGQGSCLSAPG